MHQASTVLDGCQRVRQANSEFLDPSLFCSSFRWSCFPLTLLVWLASTFSFCSWFARMNDKILFLSSFRIVLCWYRWASVFSSLVLFGRQALLLFPTEVSSHWPSDCFDLFVLASYSILIRFWIETEVKICFLRTTSFKIFTKERFVSVTIWQTD